MRGWVVVWGCGGEDEDGRCVDVGVGEWAGDGLVLVWCWLIVNASAEYDMRRYG